MEYRDTTFRNCAVDLDGNTFKDCFFENVVLNYRGGAIHLDGNTLKDCPIVIGGELARSLENLRLLAHMGGPKGVKAMVDLVSGFLRKSTPVESVTIG